LESKDGEAADLLDPTELKIIFGNLPPIYEVHRDMLADLQHALQNWRDDTTRVGAIVLKYVRLLTTTNLLSDF
jgi:protein ECT2